jgi:hypothetical protein
MLDEIDVDRRAEEDARTGGGEHEGKHGASY